MAKKNEKAAPEVNDSLNKPVAFFEKNKKIVLVALAAFVIIIAGVFVYSNYVSGPREDKASTILAKGQDYFNAEMFDVALNGDSIGYTGFLKIASDYSGTDAGNLANLYAGLCYANLEKWQEAVNYLEKYSPSNDAMVSPSAVAALGNAYVQVGNLDKAVSTLKKAASMADKQADGGVNMSIAPTFLMQAAKVLESQGKKADALKLYKEVKEKYFNSYAVQTGEVDKYIERIAE